MPSYFFVPEPHQEDTDISDSLTKDILYCKIQKKQGENYELLGISDC